MGAPGTARWIAAQKAARARLRREAIALALRRAFLGVLVVLFLLLVSPYALAADCGDVDAATLLGGIAMGAAGGWVVGALFVVGVFRSLSASER